MIGLLIPLSIVYDFDLSYSDMETLDGLDQGPDGAIVQAVKN